MRKLTLALATVGLLGLATLTTVTTPPAAAAQTTYSCHTQGSGAPITGLSNGAAKQLERQGYTCRAER
jgi:hypothetical protein